MIRFATIGTNFITEWFLDAAAKCSELEYAAVYSRSEVQAKVFADKYGAKSYYTDLNELANAKDVDAVYIASPNSLHCRQAIRMLEHGKHVLCEKPIASNLEELQRMFETAKKHKVVLLEAMRNVYSPGYERLKSELPRLGKIRRVRFEFCQYSSRYDRYKEGIIENAFKPELSNGALMDIGVYCVHPLVSLFGMPEEIKASGIFLENGIDGAGTILAKYPGMLAELAYSKITNSKAHSHIQGESASMVIKEIQDITELIMYDRKGAEEIITISRETPMLYEIEEWIRIIKGQVSAEESRSNSIMELAVMDEVRRQTKIVFPADCLSD